MKITGYRQLHGDAGRRTLSFLKIETSDGTVGWTEYYEGAGNLGLNALIAAHLDRPATMRTEFVAVIVDSSALVAVLHHSRAFPPYRVRDLKGRVHRTE